MAKKLYIGGLSFETTVKELEDLFAGYGTVDSVTIIMDKMTGRSRGFGFIEMSDEEAAGRAVEELDGKEFMGRRLTVNEARPMEERGGGHQETRGRDRGNGGGGRRQRRY